jgi:parallel beta-helix repeat protein
VYSLFSWTPAAILFGALLAPNALAQIDIRSFGARCDGSDDSGAIQAALNSVPSTGGTVVVSCSAGIGGSGLMLANKSNVTVTGSGSGAGFRTLARTGLAAGGFGPVLFVVQNCTNCVIKDLTIDNRNIAVAGVGFDRCTRSTLQNVSVSNTGYANAAIVATGGNGNSYIGNTVRTTAQVSGDGARGMWIGNGGSQTEVNATIANNTVSDAGATGIATHVNNAIIRDNLVTNVAGAGIKVTPTTGLGGQTTVERNTLRGNLFHGLQVSKADTPVNIQGNTIDGNQIAGIYASDGAFYGRITGNTITNQREAGIYLYNGNGLSIDNNQIIGNGHGVLIEAQGGYNLNNLTIAGNTISGQAAHGITFWGRGGSINSVAISSNSIYNGAIYGIFIEQNSGSLTGISASGNCFSNNSAGTIYDNRSQLSPVPSSGSCSPAATSPTTDGTAPSVAISSPGNGATVSGTIAVTAGASDNVGVAGVQFQLNGAAFGPKLTAAPYSVQWDTRTVGNGSYQWTAVATDAAGNSTTSAVVFANVANPDITAPTVRILTPASGSIVSGTVGLTASASDNIGVAAVQYSLNGAALAAELTASPYALNWNTATLAPGNYTITASARDAAGNRATSSVTVTIKDTTAPTVRITSPTAGGSIGGTVNLIAAASDNVGVAGVQFLVDGAVYGSETTSGSISCNTVNLSNGSHTIGAIARDAAGNKTTAAAISVNVWNATVQTPGTTTTVVTAVARVNAGGPAYTDPSGNVWAADSNFNGGFLFVPGRKVTGTTMAPLYESQHWNNRTLIYDLPVANGAYTVNLKFAEMYWSGPGQRLFNISINGAAVLNNFDIAAAAGGILRPVDRSFQVTVTGGRITITMVSTIDQPAVNAIEILKTTTVTSPAPAPAPVVPKTVIRVNAGGPAYKDAAGNTWSADFGAIGGQAWGVSAGIANTSTPALYQTCNWDWDRLGYQFTVPNGTYTINLKFAEIWFTGTGQRVFDVAINGQTVLKNFDMVAAAGGAFRAVDKAFTVNVTNGVILIQMNSTVDEPQINAIEISN